MVLYELLISCDVENVEALTFGGDNYEWHLKLRCYKCSKETDEIYFRGDDEVEIKDSRGTCNFQMKCKGCQQMLNVALSKAPKFVELKEKTKNLQLALFECRGCEPISWNSQGVFIKTESGVIFEDVDLTDTWVEYDEKAQLNCLIDNFKSGFQKTK